MHNIFVAGRLSASCLVLVRYEECLSIFRRVWKSEFSTKASFFEKSTAHRCDEILEMVCLISCEKVLSALATQEAVLILSLLLFSQEAVLL